MISLKSLRLLAVALLLLVASCKGGSIPPDAQPGAERWLALVDGGRYAESWTEASATFKAAIDSARWEASLGAVRTPLGALRSRASKSAKPATSLPGAPDGEYVVFQFDATFERKASAVETVTVSKERDGAWRVAGYFIK